MYSSNNSNNESSAGIAGLRSFSRDGRLWCLRSVTLKGYVLARRVVHLFALIVLSFSRMCNVPKDSTGVTKFSTKVTFSDSTTLTQLWMVYLGMIDVPC